MFSDYLHLLVLLPWELFSPSSVVLTLIISLGQPHKDRHHLGCPNFTRRFGVVTKSTLTNTHSKQFSLTVHFGSSSSFHHGKRYPIIALGSRERCKIVKFILRVIALKSLISSYMQHETISIEEMLLHPDTSDNLVPILFSKIMCFSLISMYMVKKWNTIMLKSVSGFISWFYHLDEVWASLSCSISVYNM